MLLALQSWSMIPTLGYTILMLWFARKTFLFTIFLKIKVHPRIETNLDTRNNLHSFCYWQYNHDPYIGYMILMFGFARKAFLSTIFLKIKIHPSNETNLGTHNNLHSFCYGHFNMFSSMGYMILMLQICKKGFSFLYFPFNQISSLNWSKLG